MARGPDATGADLGLWSADGPSVVNVPGRDLNIGKNDVYIVDFDSPDHAFKLT